MKKLLVLLILVIVIGAGSGFMWYNGNLGAVSKDNTDEVVVEIEEGSGAYAVIDALDEAGLIKNKTCAKLYVKLNSPDNLQANTYILNKTMSLSDMIKIIQSGEFEYILKSKFTIIEGSTYLEAAEGIADGLDLDAKDNIKYWNDENVYKDLEQDYWFLDDQILKKDVKCLLEGFIYPETYFVTDKEPTPESVTRQILDVANDILAPYKDGIEASGMSMNEFFTLASVVQSESLFEEDLPKIAGVFVNRLNEGMPLQSDITVLYALGEKRVDVTYDDLKVDSPYNTYLNAGLPPGPVSNPSAIVIDACLNYEKHDYFYFFATEDGTVLYSKTLAEHEKTVEDNLWY